MTSKRKGTDTLPFKNILAAIMQDRDLSMHQVSLLAGVSKSVVQGWLSGANPHDLPAVARLAKALGTSFKGLLLGIPEDEGQGLLAEIYDEVEYFQGMCRLSITKLVPRKPK